MSPEEIKKECDKLKAYMEKEGLTYPDVGTWYYKGAMMVLESEEYKELQEKAWKYDQLNK